MNAKKPIAIVFSCVLALFAVVLLLAAADASHAGSKSPATTQPAKGGAQVWAEICGNCHNMGSPSEFSDREWEVIVHAMRVRANLTGQEQRAITEFLKSAN